jgi:hypothetical protein
MALADLLAGLGMLAFGGSLAHATVQERRPAAPVGRR